MAARRCRNQSRTGIPSSEGGKVATSATLSGCGSVGYRDWRFPEPLASMATFWSDKSSTALAADCLLGFFARDTEAALEVKGKRVPRPKCLHVAKNRWAVLSS